MSSKPLMLSRAVFTALLLALLPQAARAQEGSRAPEPVGIEAELAQRAEAQFVLGDVVGALGTHALLEGALTGSARSASRDALWRALNALPSSTDFSAVTEPVAQGWVELMQLTRSAAPLAAYESWRQRHPDHPGESQIAAGLAAVVTPAASGQRVALLLPLTGPLAAAGKAIQAGVEAARSRAGSQAPGILAFDTGNGLDAAISAAVAQGATAVIGPLRKEDVALFAGQSVALPTIALNYLDADRAPPAGLTPFGLAPEDEARAAANHAVGRSLLRAVVLSQEGDWGSRAAAAFKAQFELRGGIVLGAESYAAQTVDFTKQLKRLLGISYSETRGEKLAATGIKAELQPVPRGDLDVVFLAARSAQVKLIWPQMRYLRAGRIATYATATAADAGNKDLGQLHVCDAPWRIETRGQIAALRGELATVNPRTADTQRLFALGFDAYELARRVSANALLPAETMSGLTGALVLEADGAVHRHLDCAPLYSPRDAAVANDTGE